jgi:lysophospholipid acyltransferase (LPLAT)-like uncharacterized protein
VGMKEDFGYRLSLTVVPRAYVMASRLLYATCRLRQHGLEHLRRSEQPGPFIAAFWHYNVLNIIHLQRSYGKNSVAMVSGSRDAEYVARALACHGFKTVRGSRHKGGLAALKKMVALMKQGLNGAIVADGSQGPARVAQAGAILLAAKTGAPIVPMLVTANRYWAFGSWDRAMLPKPFARLDLRYGEPLTVPPDLSSEGLEKLRAALENRLNGLYEEAWASWGKTEH